MSKLSDEIRKNFKESDDIRDAGLVSPEDIQRYDNILYGEDPKWQILDVYRPKCSGNKRLPVIVSVHGGAWMYGDKERYQYYCMELAQRGFAVVNFTYRLAPEFKFPSPLIDCNLVFEWILEHADQYGMDTENVFAVGDSAGAHALSLYAAILTNCEFAEQFTFTVPSKLKLNAIALNCGVAKVVINQEDPRDLTAAIMKEYLPEQGTQEELEMLSMVNHVTEEYPPTFLMTAVNDFLKMEALSMAECFTKNNVPFVYKLYGNKNEPLAHVFHCDIRTGAAKKCNDDETEFFREYMI